MLFRSLDDHRLGLLLGIAAWAMWGLFPLYFALLDQVSPIEVVAHRVIWTLVFMAVVIAFSRRWRRLRLALSKRTAIILSGAAIFLSANWLIYVYAVSTDQVVQASLGYFINPLISVALGIALLRERLRVLQWVAVAVAIVAVAILTVSYGSVPWISLGLGFSFGLYGLMKKFANIGAQESLTIETAALAPFALTLLIFMGSHGTESFVLDGWHLTLLLILLGPVTAVPLLAFGGAATRIPLSTLGVLQYITPVLQFLIGVVLFSEPMPASRWLGFAFVWTALAIFSTDAYRHARRRSASAKQRFLNELEVQEPT